MSYRGEGVSEKEASFLDPSRRLRRGCGRWGRNDAVKIPRKNSGRMMDGQVGKKTFKGLVIGLDCEGVYGASVPVAQFLKMNVLCSKMLLKCV